MCWELLFRQLISLGIGGILAKEIMLKMSRLSRLRGDDAVCTLTLAHTLLGSGQVAPPGENVLRNQLTSYRASQTLL